MRFIRPTNTFLQKTRNNEDSKDKVVHNLDHFIEWCINTTKEKQRKGECKNEKKEIEEAASMLWSEF